jgi:hypothetical protein
MTRLILAAGVAALAMTAPASARPDRPVGGDRAQVVKQERGERAQRAQRAPRMAAPRAERPQRFAALQRQEPRVERARPQRAERARPERVERASPQRVERARPQPTERVQTRAAERREVRPNRANRVERPQTRVTERREVRGDRVERTQNRAAERQQVRGARNERVQDRVVQRQELRGNRAEQAQNRFANRQEFRANRAERLEDRTAARNAFRNERIDRVRASRPLPARLVTERTRVRPFGDTVRFVGRPFRDVNRVVRLAAVPASVAYLYADTPDWYYRYGDGYVYRIDRRDDVIDWVLPLLAGGFLPGQYLPNYYMSSYVPSYYGLNSFYPSFGNDCYRYGYGVVYEVDCFTGLVEDVIPLYAGGYGVGQLLPSSYSYYNVPLQYRSLYYDTPDYGYWYGPGAIYQYDRGSSLITSVAALMSPGFAIGQPLPLGYSTYNVPYSYRTTYYDTPNAWYRYNNGYIYQVDPTTLLVTAAVASILT